jgi:hypothetical protein
MSPRVRTLRATLAVLLLLLQALLPCVHHLQHAASERGERREAPCACGHRHASSRSATRAPAAAADHEHAAGECALCQLLQGGRELLPAGEGDPVAKARPVLARRCLGASAPAGIVAALRPPVRGPPAS